MQGKYTTRSAYLKAKLRRGVIRAMIRPLAKWSRIASPEPGYSLVIACHAALARLALPSLELAARQDLTDLKETIIALDGRSTDYTRKFEDDARRIAPALNISFIYQSPRESWVCRKINWGWVDCWLSYCKALAAVKTKWAMLHDMDAMLLTPTVFRERHEAIRTRGDQYLGYRWYNGNGVAREDQIAYIVEMILDAQFVRERFRPIDLFNNVTLFKGRTIDFDTMLYP